MLNHGRIRVLFLQYLENREQTYIILRKYLYQ